MQNTQHFKELLQTEKARIEKELGTVGRKKNGDWEATETDAATVDTAEDGEVADGIEQFETNNAVLHDLEKQLTDVTNALLKIENGTYGVCEISGEPIEQDRLEANPSARTCKAHMNS